MKEKIKTIIIHLAAGIIVFLAAFLFFNHQIASEKGSPMAELAGSTYPVMEIVSDGGDYNLMKAYRGEIDLSLVRNQICLLDDSGTLGIKLHCYDYDITAVQYTLFKDDPASPLEEGTLNQLDDQSADKIRTGSIHFTSDLKEGENYYLRMAVRLNNSTRAWFYTRLQNGYSHYRDYISFALDFHQTLFDKEEALNKIGVYLETDPTDTSNSLQHVDIHSNFSSVVYGKMTVKEEQKPRIKIREINNTYAVLELGTVLSSELSGNVIQYYDVKETFKLRYNAERMFLLDYHRYMNARYNPEFIDSSNNYIGLGIQSSDQVEYISSDDGYRLAFVVAGQLWYYEYKSSNVSRVYSFTSENVADLRNDQDEHGIKILDMDEDGNITYLVYGYMSRGHHEGGNGIQILRFTPEENCNEELAFLATSVPFSSMTEDLDKLSYLSSNHKFYCLLSGDLHEVDIKNKEDVILKSGLINESLTASRDHSIIAVEKSRDIIDNTEIEVTDLNSGQTRNITVGEEERIRSIGFLNSDFIYARGKAEDISRDESGSVTFPAETLHITNINGEEVRQYQKQGRYVTDARISETVLEMRFSMKKGNAFVKTDDKDYIRYKEEDSNRITLASRISDTFGEQLYFAFPEYVYIQVAPDLLLTRIRASEDDRSLELKRNNEEVDQYFVYADGKKAATYTNLPDAVMEASQLRGNVFDNKEHMIWQCAFDEYNIVPGMDKVIKVRSDSMSLAGCLSMIAKLNGISMTPDEIDRKPGMPAALLEMCTGVKTLTLTGCALDDVLYYVSAGSPVLAKYSETRYVVVMSYNSTKIRYLDPVTGNSTVEDRAGITETFKKQGNIFYSYLAE